MASDSLASDDLAAFHHDDTYNPVDPGDGRRPPGVRRLLGSSRPCHNEFGWAANATR